MQKLSKKLLFTFRITTVTVLLISSLIRGSSYLYIHINHINVQLHCTMQVTSPFKKKNGNGSCLFVVVLFLNCRYDNCNISHRWKSKQAICESETKPSAVLISHQRANTVFSNLTANSPWQSLWFCTSVPPSSFAKAASSMLIVDFGGSCMTFSGSVQLLSPPWVTGNGSCRFSMTPLSFQHLKQDITW